MKTRGQDMPIVIVGNKTDTTRELDRVEVGSETVQGVPEKKRFFVFKGL